MHHRARLSSSIIGSLPGQARLALSALAGLVLVGGLASCSGAVEVTAADKASDPLCAKASAHWPATVGQQKQREVSIESPTVRAWGDPAIIARCGVTSPGPTTASCIDASDIDWVQRDLSDGKAFVTYGREPAIEVLIPKDYPTAPLLLAAFAKAASQIPQGTHRCS